MSVAERLAARKAATAQNRLARTGGGGAIADAQEAARSPGETPPRPKQARRRLTDIYEQRVLKSGIRKLHAVVALRQDAVPLLELPKRPNGTSKLLRPSYFERLLSNQMQLQSSIAADVVAAQSDLKHLRLEQLLALRVGTLDFATTSESHNAHNSFLSTLDRHLFEQIAKAHLVANTGRPFQLAMLSALGFQMALTLGAFMTLLAEASNDGANGHSRPVPTCWALPLDEEEWPGYTLALFHTTELRVSLLAGDSADEVCQAAGSSGAVGVVWDRTRGVGKDRMLHWEVATVDLATEDILDEFARAQRGRVGKAKTMGQALELEAALKKRVSNSWVKPRSTTAPDGLGEPVASCQTSAPAYPPCHSAPAYPAKAVPSRIHAAEVKTAAAVDPLDSAEALHFRNMYCLACDSLECKRLGEFPPGVAETQLPNAKVADQHAAAVLVMEDVDNDAGIALDSTTPARSGRSGADSPPMPTLSTSSPAPTNLRRNSASPEALWPTSPLPTTMEGKRQTGPMPTLPPPRPPVSRRVSFDADLQNFSTAEEGSTPSPYRRRQSMCEPLPPPQFDESAAVDHRSRRWSTTVG